MKKFADELISRIQKGDTKLREYMTKNHFGDYIAEHRDYKHKNEEDIIEIDKYYIEIKKYLEYGKRNSFN